MDLEGRVTIVTGASSGIGEATARLLTARGARPVLAARRADRLHELEQQLPGSLAVQADMRDREQIERLVRTTLDRCGRLDALVNNAGQGLHVPLERVRLDDLVAVTELNVYAPLLAIQAVLAPMRAQREGAIVNVSSNTTRGVFPGLGAYAATKSALNTISHVARAELAPDGIVVSLVSPSVTASEFHERLRAGAKPDGAQAITPHSPEYVAEAILRAIETGADEIVIPHGPERPIDEWAPAPA